MYGSLPSATDAPQAGNGSTATAPSPPAAAVPQSTVAPTAGLYHGAASHGLYGSLPGVSASVDHVNAAQRAGAEALELGRRFGGAAMAVIGAPERAVEGAIPHLAKGEIEGAASAGLRGVFHPEDEEKLRDEAQATLHIDRLKSKGPNLNGLQKFGNWLVDTASGALLDPLTYTPVGWLEKGGKIVLNGARAIPGAGLVGKGLKALADTEPVQQLRMAARTMGPVKEVALGSLPDQIGAAKTATENYGSRWKQALHDRVNANAANLQGTVAEHAQKFANGLAIAKEKAKLEGRAVTPDEIAQVEKNYGLPADIQQMHKLIPYHLGGKQTREDALRDGLDPDAEYRKLGVEPPKGHDGEDILLNSPVKYRRNYLPHTSGADTADGWESILAPGQTKTARSSRPGYTFEQRGAAPDTPLIDALHAHIDATARDAQRMHFQRTVEKMTYATLGELQREVRQYAEDITTATTPEEKKIAQEGYAASSAELQKKIAARQALYKPGTTLEEFGKDSVGMSERIKGDPVAGKVDSHGQALDELGLKGEQFPTRITPKPTHVGGAWQDSILAKNGVVEHVPLDLLKSIQGNPLGKTPIPELMKEIQERGIDNPLTVQFDHKNGLIKLGEGNHRVEALSRLGYTHAPVTADRLTIYENGKPHTFPKELLEGHVGREQSPSAIGLPTKAAPPPRKAVDSSINARSVAPDMRASQSKVTAARKREYGAKITASRARNLAMRTGDKGEKLAALTADDAAKAAKNVYSGLTGSAQRIITQRRRSRDLMNAALTKTGRLKDIVGAATSGNTEALAKQLDTLAAATRGGEDVAAMAKHAAEDADKISNPRGLIAALEEISRTNAHLTEMQKATGDEYSRQLLIAYKNKKTAATYLKHGVPVPAERGKRITVVGKDGTVRTRAAGVPRGGVPLDVSGEVVPHDVYDAAHEAYENRSPNKGGRVLHQYDANGNVIEGSSVIKGDSERAPYDYQKTDAVALRRELGLKGYKVSLQDADVLLTRMAMGEEGMLGKEAPGAIAARVIAAQKEIGPSRIVRPGKLRLPKTANALSNVSGKLRTEADKMHDAGLEASLRVGEAIRNAVREAQQPMEQLAKEPGRLLRNGVMTVERLQSSSKRVAKGVDRMTAGVEAAANSAGRKATLAEAGRLQTEKLHEMRGARAEAITSAKAHSEEIYDEVNRIVMPGLLKDFVYTDPLVGHGDMKILKKISEAMKDALFINPLPHVKNIVSLMMTGPFAPGVGEALSVRGAHIAAGALPKAAYDRMSKQLEDMGAVSNFFSERTHVLDQALHKLPGLKYLGAGYDKISQVSHDKLWQIDRGMRMSLLEHIEKTPALAAMSKYEKGAYINEVLFDYANRSSLAEGLSSIGAPFPHWRMVNVSRQLKAAMTNPAGPARVARAEETANDDFLSPEDRKKYRMDFATPVDEAAKALNPASTAAYGLTTIGPVFRGLSEMGTYKKTIQDAAQGGVGAEAAALVGPFVPGWSTAEDLAGGGFPSKAPSLQRALLSGIGGYDSNTPSAFAKRMMDWEAKGKDAYEARKLAGQR